MLHLTAQAKKCPSGIANLADSLYKAPVEEEETVLIHDLKHY
jgi:hypothetical protein